MENYRGRNTKGRMPLTAKQVGILFQTLVQQVNCPWALCLFQLFLGDRADAARQASTEWFRFFEPRDGNPPSVAIPGNDPRDRPALPIPREIARGHGLQNRMENLRRGHRRSR